jgi:hypothetical protein
MEFRSIYRSTFVGRNRLWLQYLNIYRKDVVSGKKITIPLIVIEEV